MTPEGADAGGGLEGRIHALLENGPAGAARGGRRLATELEGQDRRRAERTLARVLGCLEAEAGAGSGSADPGDARERAVRLTNALALLRALRDHVLPRWGQPQPAALRETRHELAWVERSHPGGAGARKLLQAVADHVDRVQVEEIESLVSAGTTLEEPGRLLDRLDHELRVQDRRHGTHTEALLKARETLWRRLEESPDTGESGRGPRLHRLADRINERCEDRLAEVDVLGPDESIRLLERGLEDVRRALALTPPRPVRRSLRRMRRRLVWAIQDKAVRRGQEALLGARGVRILEAGLLVLILVLVVLLGALFLDEPGRELRRRLALLDTAVCGVFLGEFFWRTSLAPRKLLYLFRYAATDLLPVLPFALFTEVIRAGAAPAGGLVRNLGPFAKTVRVLRLVRPLVYAARIQVFLVRGVDRLVRGHASVLNRNVVVFEPQGHEMAHLDLAVRMRNLDERLARARRRLTSDLQGEARKTALEAALEGAVERLGGLPPAEERLGFRPPRTGSDIRLEWVVHRLQHLTPEDIQERLDADEAERLSRLLRRFDLPLLRRLPVLGRMVPGAREPDPYDGLCRAAKGLGRFLEGLLERLRFLGDLKGIVTGPQLLDRVGRAMVSATRRPAFRLMGLGLLSVVGGGLVDMLPSDLAGKLADVLKERVGTGLIILGGACTVVLALGIWIRHLAGEATDLFRKVAEAQGINLLKLHKQKARNQDLNLIFRSVVGPELALGPAPDPGRLEESRARFTAMESGKGSPDSARLLLEDRVLLLYQDYLDGAVLHRSDVKTTEQFLGNLDIATIRDYRLDISRRERRALAKLDLSSERALPTGPYLWFRFITDSLAEKTAKLVLEYNRHAVPLEHRHLVPAERLAQMQAWLQRRQGDNRRGRRRLLDLDPGGVSRFTSLHFLGTDPVRDTQVAREFGQEVLERLREDRRAMIRSVFGCYPFEQLPRERRTFNPYRLYHRWLGRGLFLVLPLRLFLHAFVYALRGIRRLVILVRTQLRPGAGPRQQPPSWAPLAVALRKVNRMRRPVFMAALDLRARFDPEYLGVALPGRRLPDPDLARIEEDLTLIGATESDHQRYQALADAHTRRIARLQRLLNDRGWPHRSLLEALEPGGPAAPRDMEAEAARAVAGAWLVDYQRCRTLVAGHERAQAALDEALDQPGLVRPRRFLFRPALRRALEVHLEAHPGLRERPRELARLRGVLRANLRGAREALLRIREAGGREAARQKACGVLAAVARYPMPWSQELVTLRTVQTLTCLDVNHTRRVVQDLGGYAERGAETPAGRNPGGPQAVP